MVKKLNKIISTKIVNTGNKRFFLQSNGKKCYYQKEGDLDVEINGIPLIKISPEQQVAITFDYIKDLESKNNDLLDLIETMNTKLLGALARINVLEGN